MTGPKADAILARDPTAKKKKRKHESSKTSSASGAALAIVDDDAGWGRPIKTNDEDEDEDTKEAVVASDRTFKKRRKMGDDGGWVKYDAEGQEEKMEDVVPEDEKPIVVNEEQPRMKGGLMSHAELTAKFSASTMSSNKKDEGPTAEQMETVYRDASGRKIDTKAAKAEAARLKREQEEMEAKRMEWGKGIVQREDQEKKRREMELERGKGFERYGIEYIHPFT